MGIEEKMAIASAIDTIAQWSNEDAAVIIEALVGVCFDEEEAGELEHYFEME